MCQLKKIASESILLACFGMELTSAGEGLWCGHLIVLAPFVVEDRRFSGFRTVSKLAKRAAKVSISEPMMQG